jgi:hypothetical protein
MDSKEKDLYKGGKEVKPILRAMGEIRALTGVNGQRSMMSNRSMTRNMSVMSNISDRKLRN